MTESESGRIKPYCNTYTHPLAYMQNIPEAQVHPYFEISKGMPHSKNSSEAIVLIHPEVLGSIVYQQAGIRELFFHNEISGFDRQVKREGVIKGILDASKHGNLVELYVVFFNMVNESRPCAQKQSWSKYVFGLYGST